LTAAPLGGIIIAKICNNKELRMSCGQRLVQELREYGFRVTPQRAIILETIAHGEDHQSANQVYRAAKERLPGLNLATVYRTLDALHRVGMVDVFSAHSQNVEFSLHDSQNPHDHLVCRNCGQVFEIPADTSRGLSRQVAQDYGFEVEVGHLMINGLCADCSGANRGRHVREG
jgi:Fur family ferric uptake transcriptional regulator